MHRPGKRWFTTSAVVGLAVSGGLAGSFLAAGPAGAATARIPGAPSTPAPDRAAVAPAAGNRSACPRSGAIEGSQASTAIHHRSVLVGLPGYNPDRTSSDSITNSGTHSALGGLLNDASTPGYPSWTATTTASTSRSPGAVAPVMKGSIEGSQATFTVHHRSVLVGLPGYNPDRTSSDTITNSGTHSALGGLLNASTPGYPSWGSGTSGSAAGCGG